MGITLTINNVDFSDRVLTYTVRKEITYGKTYTSVSGKEFVRRKRIRPIVSFTLMPHDDAQALADYNVLKANVLTATFTDPDVSGTVLTKEVRLMTNLEHVFLLDSINGKRYYRGGTIQLRSTTVM